MYCALFAARSAVGGESGAIHCAATMPAFTRADGGESPPRRLVMLDMVGALATYLSEASPAG